MQKYQKCKDLWIKNCNFFKKRRKIKYSESIKNF